MLLELLKCNLRFALVTLVAIVSVSALYLLYFIAGNHHGTQKALGVRNNLFSIERSGGHVAILLQQSQVQVHAQFTRLMAIDAGWATWRTSKDEVNKVEVFAAVPYELISEKVSQIKNINLLSMLPVSSAPAVEGSPYHQMINSLYRIISDAKHTTTKWIVMANDHTFIIPPNLQRFLNTLDAERLIYSGNELRMQYKNRVLSFASGGAGAVMSHVVVKLMLVVWVTAWQQSEHLPWVTLLSGPRGGGAQSDLFSCTADSIVADLRSTGRAVETVLSFLHLWETADGGGAESLVCGETQSPPHASPRSKVTAVRHGSSVLCHELSPPFFCVVCPFMWELQVVLRLSSRVRAIITRSAADGAVDHSVALLRSGAVAGTPHSSGELRKECTAQNKWERTNPGTEHDSSPGSLFSTHVDPSVALPTGIILAHCIGKVFGVDFASSTTSEVHRPKRSTRATRPLLPQGGGAAVKAERFNVYGVLRTLLSDFDAWYVDAKRPAEAISAAASKPGQGVTGGADGNLSVLAKDVVSFHYVSETESRLLYELLSPAARGMPGTDTQGLRHLKPICRSQRAPRSIRSSPNTTLECSTAREIHALWPATDKAAGHYSRALSRGPTSFHEAELLFEYLSSVTVG